MHLSLLIYILLLPILVTSQTWKAAEWTTSEHKNVSGWVKIPTFLWDTPSDIKLKVEENGKAFNGLGVLALYLREGRKDTLVLTPFFDGHYHQLQQITNGEVPFFKELKADGNDYFIYRNSRYEKWDRYNKKEDLRAILRVEDSDFYQKILFDYNEDLVLRLIRKLNRTKLDGELAIHKWRYSLAYLSSAYRFNSVIDVIGALNPYKIEHQFHLGVQRNLSQTYPYFSMDVYLTYLALYEKDIYRFQMARYDRELKVSFLKFYGSVRSELLPRRNISPFISVGYVLSIPTKYERILKASTHSLTLGGLPSSQEINIKSASEIGRLVNFGLRVNLSEKTRLNAFFQVEIFDAYVKLSEFEIPSPAFEYTHDFKKTPDEYLLGLSLTHSFYKNRDFVK